MLDIKTQSQIADATASMMRWCVTAAINASAASASRGMALWSELMDAASAPGATAAASRGEEDSASTQPRPVPPIVVWASWPLLADKIPSTSPLARTWWLGPDPGWGPLAGLNAWSRVSLPAWNGWLAQVAAAPPHREKANGAAKLGADDGAYSAYRSAGGHAAAQVIMGPMPSGRSNGQAAAAKHS
jgi:hypothetical protein